MGAEIEAEGVGHRGWGYGETEGWDEWGGVEQAAGHPVEAVTRESLTDQALAESLTRLGSGETSGWMGKMNETIFPEGAYDKTTLTVAAVLAVLIILLFTAGVVYYLT